MGRLVCPSKEIDEDADDKAHLDTEAPKVIKYINASKGHEYIVDRVLTPDEGITHDVFKEQEDEAPADDDDEEGKKKETVNDVLAGYKGVVYVPEVIREKRMHFQ